MTRIEKETVESESVHCGKEAGWDRERGEREGEQYIDNKAEAQTGR